jgi:hypothetical protein
VPSSRNWCAAIFVAVFACSMLGSSREPAWGDAHPMWELADRIVQHGALDIKTRWPEDIPPGRDGKTYGIAAIGCALVHVPGVAIAALGHRIAPSQDGLVRPIATHLAPSALGGLAAVLFFLLLIDLGIGRRTAGACTAILAFATTTWVYAHYPYADILQLACFLGLFRAAIRTSADPSRREALWLGAWAGMLVNTKYVFALSVVGAAVLVAWTLRTRRDDLKRVAGWACVTGAPFMIIALAYNWIRWGSPFSTGYGPYLGAYFGGSIVDGAWGMLASPNKSALLYSPPLVLALIGMPAAFRAVPRLALALVVMVVPTLLVYCTYRSWSGDYAWGPRYFVWAVPPLLVPIAWFVDRTAPPSGGASREGSLALVRLTRVRKLVLGVVIAGGVIVQLLGASLYWDHFIRISTDAKNQWLGQPNRKGAYIAERGRGHCDSCFEDTYELLWTPAFNPIRGHLWLLESLARGDDAASAQADAPWRTYTSLQVNLDASYPRARVDWWGLLWISDFPGTRTLGAILLLIFAAGSALGIARWIRLQRMRE